MAIIKMATQLRAVGETIPDGDRGRISPLMHRHVIPNGAYFALPKQGNEISGYES